MTRGPVFVEPASENSPSTPPRRGSNTTSRGPRGSKDESQTPNELNLTKPQLTAEGPTSQPSGDFDVFEYLNDSDQTDLLRDPILQRMTIIKYDGEINDHGFFHGKGSLVSTLGYAYTGELDRGLMHGSGSVTWSSGITFVGRFKNNVPHGKGKYTWPNGDWYEGEVVDAVRSGSGVFFYSALKATYSGEWLKGMRHGKGELIYNENSRYNGYWVRDKKEGKGLMIYDTQDRYEGEWKDDKRHGYGIMVWITNGNVVEVYKGNWVEGQQHGEGFSMYIRPPATLQPNTFQPPVMEGTLGDIVPPKDSAVNTYRGQHKKGLRHGFGVFAYDDGSKYEGMWHDHQKHGEGKYTTANGVVTIEQYEHGSSTNTAHAQLAAATSSEDATVVEALSVEAAGVPLYIRDVLGPSENNVPESVLAVQSILLRHSGVLRRIFNQYSNLADGVAVLTTPASWRRDRTQGTMALIQFLRCLSDARLLNCNLTVAEVDRILTAISDRNTPTYADSNHSSDGTSTSSSAPSSGSPQSISLLQTKLSTPWASYKEHVHEFVGEMSFRDFTEALVRLASFVYSDDVYGPIAHRVLIVVEDHLTPLLLPGSMAHPICPSTRAHKEHLIPYTGMLQDLFLYFSEAASLSFAATPPSSSSAAKSSKSSTLAGITMRVRQCLLMFKEANCFVDDRFSIPKALHTLFPYDKHPAFTAAVHRKRLLPPPVVSSQVATRQPTPPQMGAPRGNVSESGASTFSGGESSSAAVTTPTPQTGLSESAYRGRWLQTERSKGIAAHNLHSTIQPELELTFVEFVEAVVAAALMKETANAPFERIKSFFANYLQPLHATHC